MSLNDVLNRLARPAKAGRTESDVQSDIQTLLLTGNFGLDEPHLEKQVGDGSRRRIDIAIGATVIEVKADLNEAGVLSEAEPQLSGYVETQTEQHGSRYNGILTDGRTWLLYENDPVSGDFRQRASYSHTTREGSGAVLTEWLQSVLATQRNMTPNPRTIESHLGASSPAFAQDHAFLTGMYERVSTNPTVELKRALWARLLRSALGTSFEDDANLFVDHTLLVIEAAAIGHAIMGINPADLIARPHDLLAGNDFTSASIENVIEADFFAWVLEDEDGAQFVAQIVRRVSVFDWAATEHDVLKHLYESVIQADTRRSLGEYYTPDWLAEGIVEKAVTNPLNQRVLDPACGSGTFVYHAVRRYCEKAEAAGLDNTHVLRGVQEHVYGMDIHPVSVVLARITYLLALGERLSRPRDTVTVPIYLGDSIQWSQDTAAQTDTIKVRVDSSDLAPQQDTLLDIAETLVFPLANMDDPETFDRLVHDMTEHAKRHVDPAAKRPDLKPILRRFGLTSGPDATILTETFKLLCDLHAQGRDTIWGYYVRNQVRPMWLSMEPRRVDVLIGNPPWVAYRSMSDSMQTQFRTFSERRNLWHGKKVATHQDLVGLFIARAAELYLNDGGRFAFVTPLAVLSRQQYEGFRAGKWGPVLRGHLTEMWDLNKVRPVGFFPVPAGVIFGERYVQALALDAPRVPYGSPSEKIVVEGLRDKSGWAKTRDALTFTSAKNVTLTAGDALPDEGYGANAIQGANIVPRYLFMVTEQAAGATRLGQAQNRVTISSKRSTQEKLPWKNQPGLTATVEKRFIHDVHLGSTITPHRTLTPERAVIPIDGTTFLTEKAIQNTPGLNSWWSQASPAWEAHRSAKTGLSLREQLDYHGKLRRQVGGPKYRVLYTASGNTLAAVWVDDPSIVVEHSLYWVPVSSAQEARYLTAILNAPATTRAASAFQSLGLFGARHFDKYVWRLGIPPFDPTNDSHVLLAALAEDAEHVATSVSIPHALDFKIARKHVRDALHEAGITPQVDTLVTALLGLEGTVATEAPDPNTAVKAAAIRDGKTVIRLPNTAATFPAADVSIDIDCEYDHSGVYLWGATLTDGECSEYVHFGTPNASEKEAASKFVNWLTEQFTQASGAGKTVRVFHYGHVEATHLQRILGKRKIADLLTHFVDMLPILRAGYFAPNGYSLKTLAPAFGATWRTPNATGEDTLRWITEARDGDNKAWYRIVAYNEDDTRATRVLRKELGLM